MKRLIKIAESDSYFNWVNEDNGEEYTTSEPISLKKWDNAASLLINPQFVADSFGSYLLNNDINADEITKTAVLESSYDVTGIEMVAIPYEVDKPNRTFKECFPKTFAKAESVDIEKAKKIVSEKEIYNDRLNHIV